MRAQLQRTAAALLCASILIPIRSSAAGDERGAIQTIVAQAIRPVMSGYRVPGMAVGVVVRGHGYVFDYGVASRATKQPVSSDTLFEIGSISKTFTATLASYAQVRGKLHLSDDGSAYLPALRGSSFDRISLLELATHTSGGLPQQVPDDVTNDAQLMAYFRNWRPAYAPGTYRLYSNLGIGLLGVIAAKSMHVDFASLMDNALFAKLDLKNTYLDVPETAREEYAQGYTTTDTPIRMAPGVLAPEAYGIRTTAGDLLRFVEANMHVLALEEPIQRAILQTHTGYYRLGAMTQDVIWEQYSYPLQLSRLLAGNSEPIAFEANPVTKIDPPSPPRDDVLINKTGSTNGFASYVAFVPGERIGVVILANKSYPIDARVKAAYKILTGLADRRVSRGAADAG